MTFMYWKAFQAIFTRLLKIWGLKSLNGLHTFCLIVQNKRYKYTLIFTVGQFHVKNMKSIPTNQQVCK